MRRLNGRYPKKEWQGSDWEVDMNWDFARRVGGYIVWRIKQELANLFWRMFLLFVVFSVGVATGFEICLHIRGY